MKIHSISFGVFSKSFLAVYPFHLFHKSTFPNSTILWKFYNYIFSVLSFFKHIFKLKLFNNKHIVVWNMWATGYHHFICEIITKLVVNYDEIKSNTIILPSNINEYYIIFLKEFFPLLNFEFHSGSFLIYKGYLIENPSSGYFTSQHLFELKKFLNLKSYSNTHLRRVYLSRNKSRSRRISNEEMLFIELKKFNFDIVYCDDMTIKQQIDFFSQTSLLLSPHGAGLTNMIFMPCNSVIIELMPIINEYDKFDQNHCYRRLSHSLQHSYHSVLVEKSDKKLDYNDSDLIIDMQLLSKLLISLHL